MSLHVIRAFVVMREQIAENALLLRRFAEVEKTLLEHDQSLHAMWRELVPLLQPKAEPPKRRIGFQPGEASADSQLRKF